MRRTIVQAVAGAAVVAAAVTACGSGDSNSSSGSSSSSAAPPGAGAPSSAGQGAANGAVGQVNSAIEQALQQSPLTFEPQKADLTDKGKQTVTQIAKALQGNDVKITVATHAGYPDAQQAKTLSEKRAQAIASDLEGQGVAKDRVKQEATGNEKAQGDQALNTQISVAQ
ncbi:OmpA family protein [Amycolatopsis sp. NPDC059021]|uniref:OmpA family protein n=1 Tax=Amycolatopsis sp. NPDC059021 TaxID=3346704 RepID=UPI003672498E